MRQGTSTTAISLCSLAFPSTESTPDFLRSLSRESFHLIFWSSLFNVTLFQCLNRSRQSFNLTTSHHIQLNWFSNRESLHSNFFAYIFNSPSLHGTLFTSAVLLIQLLHTSSVQYCWPDEDTTFKQYVQAGITEEPRTFPFNWRSFYPPPPVYFPTYVHSWLYSVSHLHLPVKY